MRYVAKPFPKWPEIQREFQRIADSFAHLRDTDLLWDDNTADMRAGTVKSGAPVLTDINGGPSQAYVFAVGDSVNLSFHIKHDIKPGSLIYPHIHWTTDGTNTGTLTWRISYQYSAGHARGTFTTASTMDLTATASGTAWTHEITEASDSQAFVTPEVDSLILVNVKLQSASGFGTPADDIFGLYADLHYQKNALGTKLKSPPFY